MWVLGGGWERLAYGSGCGRGPRAGARLLQGALGLRGQGCPPAQLVDQCLLGETI